ncbi:SseB family protein [Catenibacterium sp. co_0103]|uniref:SseB family protein n=1 Tax=Catenibacterium sp. co_0103 TaxID=2478954 RepID=UPI00247A8687|nr:SseB family protein [Catenibacterium sp. co_0103]
MDYNGLSIVSPQHYPDGKEWNNFFNLWFQDYDINTDITERFHYLISHSDYLVMVQRPLNSDDQDYEIISVSNEQQQSYLPAFTNIKEITDYIDLPDPQEGYQVEIMVASYKRLLEEIYMRTEGLSGLVINPLSQKLIADEKLLNSIGHNTTIGINHHKDLPSLVPANLKFRKNMKIYHSNGKRSSCKRVIKRECRRPYGGWGLCLSCTCK